MPQAGESPPPVSASAPDWSTIVEDTFCPLCDYNLRGLIESRCPECGYRFLWTEVLDPTRRRHRYLFEHHPQRNVWSFFKTLFGGLRPRRFWSSLYPTQPSRRRRLIGYALVTAAPLLFLCLGILGMGGYNYAQDIQQTRARFAANLAARSRDPAVAQLIGKHGSIQAYVDTIMPRVLSAEFWSVVFRRTSVTTRMLLMLLIWPAATYVALLVFRISMRRARIKSIHVVRCIAYSFDALFWPGVLWLAVLISLAIASPNHVETLLSGDFRWRRFLWNGSLELYCAICFLYAALAVALILSAYRLATAYRLYLRFDHPLATVLVSQLIVLLLMAYIFVDGTVFLMLGY